MPEHFHEYRALILLSFTNRSGTSKTPLFPLFNGLRKLSGSAFSGPRRGLSSVATLLGVTSLLLALSPGAQASAQPSAVAAQIDAALANYLNGELLKEAKRNHWHKPRLEWDLSSRANENLQPCQGAIAVSSNSALRSGRMRVELSCQGAPAWQIASSVSVTVWLPVWVATNTLERGVSLAAEHLTKQEVDLRKLQRGFYQNREPLLGLTVKRRLRPQQVLAPMLLDQPLLVRRGQRLEVMAGDAHFAVSVSAEALEDGAEGDLIKLRNLSSGKTLEARITAPGKAESTL